MVSRNLSSVIYLFKCKRNDSRKYRNPHPNPKRKPLARQGGKGRRDDAEHRGTSPVDGRRALSEARDPAGLSPRNQGRHHRAFPAKVPLHQPKVHASSVGAATK